MIPDHFDKAIQTVLEHPKHFVFLSSCLHPGLMYFNCTFSGNCKCNLCHLWTGSHCSVMQSNATVLTSDQVNLLQTYYPEFFI